MIKKMRDIPKISVVIPVYNMEKYLKECLDSIKNQSFKEFEAIIIDNGSIDNSIKIAKEYQKKDERFIVKTLSKPGVLKAMNTGLDIAKGKYIAKMDADDICLKDKFNIQFNYLETHPDIFLVGSSAEIIDEKGNKIGIFKKYDNPKRIKKRILKSNPFIHSSIMYRNQKDLRYREKFLISEEYDMFFRLIEDNKNLTNLPDILMKYRVRSDSIVSTKPNQRYFFEKAREFHKQREKYGRDAYENLKAPLIEQKQEDFQKVYLNTKILAEFQDNQMNKAREDIKFYFKKYGFSKLIGGYYILSFLPERITNFLRERVF